MNFYIFRVRINKFADTDNVVTIWLHFILFWSDVFFGCLLAVICVTITLLIFNLITEYINLSFLVGRLTVDAAGL